METYGLSFEHLLKEKKKIQFEFQDVILQCIEYFGEKHNGLLWSLPYKPKHTESVIRDSLKICKLGGKDIKYFMGIIRNKTK